MSDNSRGNTLAVQRRLSFVDDQSVNSNELNDQRKRSMHLAPPGANGITLQPILAVNVPTERRQSQWNAAGKKSIFLGRRYSQALSFSSRKSSQDLPLQRTRYQNTYRLSPDDHNKFCPYKVEPKVHSILEEMLKDKKYDSAKSAQLSKEISESIMRETRNCLYQSRYKLVAHVVIGQDNGQDIRCASRCLWDANNDDYVTVVLRVNDIYAVATVFALYFD